MYNLFPSALKEKSLDSHLLTLKIRDFILFLERKRKTRQRGRTDGTLFLRQKEKESV